MTDERYIDHALRRTRRTHPISMIRLRKHIRLTKKEVERFTTITGFEPVNVRTLDDLDAYIARCERHYWGVSKDTQFLHWLIDKEHARCLGGR